MGFFTSSEAACGPLQPLPQPIGVFSQFANHNETIAFKVREKAISITGDSFDIKDAVTGNKAFKVDGKFFTIHGRKQFLDAAGNSLLDIKKKHLHIHTTYAGEADEKNTQFPDKNLFTIQAGIIDFTGTKLTVTFKNYISGGGKEEEIELKGSFFNRSAELKYKNQVVGMIGRKFATAGQVFGDAQTYVVTVAPGVDTALILAICVCMDEKQEES